MGLASWYSLNSTMYEFWTAERDMLEADIMAARESEGTDSSTRLSQMPPNESALNLANNYLCQIHSIEQKAGSHQQQIVRQLDTLRWLLYRAREQLILAQPADQALDARRQKLLAEVNDDEFYTTSERVAINQLLQGATDRRRFASDEPDLAESGMQAANRAQAVANAYRIRDDIQATNFFRLRITRHYQLILLTVGIPVLAATVYFVAAYSGSFNDLSWKRGWVPVFMSSLLGVLGAIVSAGQRSTRMRPQTIADQLGAWVATLSRIPIGAVAGLTVWIFSLAAISDDVQHLGIGNVLIAAFGAGFTERLAVQGARPQGEEAKSK
jgi:hypothetical protein